MPYYEAVALIGLEITAKDLYRENKRRGCGCYPNESVAEVWQFCPACSQPIWVTAYDAIPDWDAADACNVTLAGLPVIMAMSADSPGLEKTQWGREAILRGARMFVGELCSRTDMASPARRSDVYTGEHATVKDRLKAILEPVGIVWDDAKFGLWAVLTRVK